ncbi:MAG: cohesin domain-containing protein [Chloroflexi bacterium]|nr:cohesin domain-containing protein [Chloroflexota bacterium]MDA1271562.1 cohesin domain-containing protein [Chloroflexota bacterium]PKB58335.1 MAG: hypothetical protein BZY83_07465 [SAR202 cluster bacterium Casp-Chloro-G2]
MRWLLEVAFIGLASSWKWVVGSIAGVGLLIGLLFAVGVLGGGGGSDGGPDRVGGSSTPTPAAVGKPTATPRAAPTATAAPDPVVVATPKMISVPILATRASNVGSLEFILTFDPAKLEFAQLERGTLAGKALIDSSSPGPGRLWAGIIDVDGMTGSGPVAVVRFKLREGAAGTMPLGLESISAFNASTLVDILTKTTPGQFNGGDLAPLSPIVTFQ